MILIDVDDLADVDDYQLYFDCELQFDRFFVHLGQSQSLLSFTVAPCNSEGTRTDAICG